MDKLVKIFKALSDEMRLKIVNLLYNQEHCVGEIAEMLKSTQPNISFHLGVLLDAGLITGRQYGKNICYFINTADIFWGFLINEIVRQLNSKDSIGIKDESVFENVKTRRICRRRDFILSEVYMKGGCMKRHGIAGAYGAKQMGQGGFGLMRGSGENCVCLSCGYTKPHIAGTPCRTERCPKCGKAMVREGSYHHRLVRIKEKVGGDE